MHSIDATPVLASGNTCKKETHCTAHAARIKLAGFAQLREPLLRWKDRRTGAGDDLGDLQQHPWKQGQAVVFVLVDQEIQRFAHSAS